MPIINRYIPLIFIGLISACINVPGIDPNTPDSGTQDSGSVDTPDSGTQPSDLSVSIMAPTGTFYTSSSVTFSVDVRGGTPDLVQLFRGAEELATIPLPYTYTWNTETEAEGIYTITARATKSGRTFPSEPVTVIVDRTKLQVSSRSPAPGMTNVPYSTPIQVVFSKPVKATTVSDTTVSFAVSGVLAEKTLSLSSDGKTLTLTPKVRPPLPATFSVGLSSGITDSAGNALVVPSTSWNFELPSWYAFGGPLNAVSGNTQLKDTAMVLDSQDNPVIAWSEERTTGGRSSIFVYRWDGRAFTPIGDALNGTSVGSAYKPALALDGRGNPIIAWQESDGFNDNIYVKRWTGIAWQSVGSGLLSAENDTRPSPTPTPARNPSLAVRGNEIYIAWDEMTVEEFSTIHVRKSVDGGSFSAVDRSGGSVSAVPQLSSASNPSLALDSNGQPVVAFQEQTLEQNRPTNIYVMRLKQDGYWTYSVPPFYGNDASGYVSGGLSAATGNTLAQDCSLSIDTQDNLYLSWSEESHIDGPRDIQVFRSTGPQSWERLGSALSTYDGFTSSGQAKIHVTPSGKISIVWKEFDGYAEAGYGHLFASEWANNSWNTLTTRDGLNQDQKNSLLPVIAIDSVGRTVVAWYESRDAVDNAAGDYVYVRRYNN
ncbi:Ig-like domain-containing protein [Archangium minus]